MFKGTFHLNEEQGMSDIVIRHAEPKDIDAIRQIHAQPEVYHNTLQVPHPSEHMWRERLTDTPGVKQIGRASCRERV